MSDLEQRIKLLEAKVKRLEAIVAEFDPRPIFTLPEGFKPLYEVEVKTASLQPGTMRFVGVDDEKQNSDPSEEG